MGAWAALLQPNIAGVLLLFALMQGLFVGLALWIEGRLSSVPFYRALFRCVGHPLLRIVPLLGFLSYGADAFFGWDHSNGSESVNGLVGTRFSNLLNILFLISLALPQLPVLTRFHAPLLLIQLILAFSLLFAWQIQSMGIDSYTLLPGLSDGLIIVILSLSMHVVGRSWARAIGRWVEFQFHRRQGDLLAEEILAVLLQSPALLIYTRHLGNQLNLLTS